MQPLPPQPMGPAVRTPTTAGMDTTSSVMRNEAKRLGDCVRTAGLPCTRDAASIARSSTLSNEMHHTLSLIDASPAPPMGSFVRRASVTALVALILDEAVKTLARLRLAPCTTSFSTCDRVDLLGPLQLVRTTNAGSAYGFIQGWGGWVVLALV